MEWLSFGLIIFVFISILILPLLKERSLDRKKIIPLSENDFFVRTSDVSPTLAPDVVKTNVVRGPKPSSKKAVDEYLNPEQEILAAAKLRGDEDTFLNFNKILKFLS